jgi:tetratricopeptide (TPR) repeat protein
MARYMFSEDDFQDEGIRRIVSSLRSGGNIEKLLIALFERRQMCCTQEDTSDDCWEAMVLACQMRFRIRQFGHALNDCEWGIDKGPKRLRPLFQFLKNAILSHTRGKFKDALEGSRQLVDQHGEDSPRYGLQLGYLIWQAYEKGMKGYTLEEANKQTKIALELARKDYDRSQTCYRLALSNLANFNVAMRSLDDAEAYLHELNAEIEKISEEGMIGMFHYTRAHVMLEVLRRDCQDRVKPSDFDERFMRIREEYGMIYRKRGPEREPRGPGSKFAEKMYRKLGERIEEFKEEFKDYGINEK